MADIGFYHLTRTSLAEALPALLEKALAAGLRVVVRAPSEAEAERLSLALWTYGEGTFLPHGTEKDGWEAEQPVFLTGSDRNPNGAAMLVQVGGMEWGGPLGFARIADMFDGADPEAVAAARERWRRNREAGHTLAYWRQKADRGWEKAG